MRKVMRLPARRRKRSDGAPPTSCPPIDVEIGNGREDRRTQSSSSHSMHRDVFHLSATGQTAVLSVITYTSTTFMDKLHSRPKGPNHIPLRVRGQSEQRDAMKICSVGVVDIKLCTQNVYRLEWKMWYCGWVGYDGMTWKDSTTY